MSVLVYGFGSLKIGPSWALKDKIRVGDLGSRSSKIGPPKVLKDNIRVGDIL